MNLLKQLDKAVKKDKHDAIWMAHVAICQSKRSFASKALAKRECKHMISKGAEPTVKPYKCRVCKRFHLTRR